MMGKFGNAQSNYSAEAFIATPSCIDQIFISIDDLIEGKMICGAGGGGFLQVVMKKGITFEDLKTRLDSVFSGSGVEVWKCEFDF